MTAILDAIGEKVAAGLPLGPSDVRALASAADIVSLGMIADGVRRRRHGVRTTFVRVARVRVADISTPGISWPDAAREIRITDRFPGIDEALAAVRSVARAVAMPVTGFTLHEILEAAADPARLGDWLVRLKAEGLAAVATASVDRLPALDAAARAISHAGITVGAWAVEQPVEGDTLAAVHAVQQAIDVGFDVRAFAPIPRRPGPDPTTGYADVKGVALARILLDVPHIQVDWALHGPKLAQVALTFGADDVDGVSPLDETPDGRRRAPLEEITRNIRAAGLEPLERDGRFALVP